MRTIGFTEAQTACVSEPLPEITKETEIPDVTDEAAAEDTAEEPVKTNTAKRRQKKTEDADETAGNA